MVGKLLARGMLAGIVAGLLAFGFARLFGEPPVAGAIAFEEEMDHAAADHAKMDHSAMSHAPAGTETGTAETEPPLVSREVQSGIGLFTGAVVYGAALGGLFALVFAVVHGRVGRLGPRATAALLAGAGFIAVVVAPGLKYPANPPSVGLPETIGLRTELYFLMIAISLAAMVLAINLGRRLAARLGAWNAALLAIAAFVAIVAIADILLPAIDEVPEKFPAALLWNFRVAALGMQLIMWAALGLLFGALSERSLRDRLRTGSPLPAPAWR